MSVLKTPEYRLLKEIRKAKISSNQGIALLLMLENHPRGQRTTRVTDVAKELECSDTQASTLMATLEKKRNVYQTKVGRRFEYALTTKGKKLAGTLLGGGPGELYSELEEAASMLEHVGEHEGVPVLVSNRASDQAASARRAIERFNKQ